MAPLEDPHWETLSPKLREILEEVGRHPFARRFYLAGGTALALQLGHRKSIDLDFFSATDQLEPDSRKEIVTALSGRFPLEIDEGGLASLLLGVEGNFVGFFGYSYPLLAPTRSLAGVLVAGLLDIGLMKLDAIAGRGSRKDFYDLYFLARHLSLDEMLDRAGDKFPQVRDFGVMALTALADFSLADQETDITTAPQVGWGEVKGFFINEIRRIGRDWFE